MSFIQSLKEFYYAIAFELQRICWIVSVDYTLSDSKILITVFFLAN